MSEQQTVTLTAAVKPKRKHQRRDRRAENPPRMRETERDREIVRAIYDYRVLNYHQIARLFFGDISRCQRVLARLYHHGYLERVFLPVIVGSSPALYVLDKRGVELLRTHFGMEDTVWYPTYKSLKSEFLEHMMAINDFRITVTLACQRFGYHLQTWLTDHQIKAQNARKDYDKVQIRKVGGNQQWVSIVPDSYFVVQTPRGTARFFLELDRGTMSLSAFKNKVLAYIAYHDSGLYEKRYGAKSLRVLTVVPQGAKRIANLKTATEEVKGERRFWFAEGQTLTPENVFTEAVWSVAQDSYLYSLLKLD